MEGKGLAHNLEANPRTSDVRLKELAPFSKMVLSDQVRKGLHQAGFVYPTVIQATAIPVGKSGIDLLVQSKSGTGKTLIFCSIVLEAYKSDVREPQSLIVAPTREIATQIEDTLNNIGKYCTGFKAVRVIGGLDVAEDRKRVQGAKAIVGTPGRILHLIQNEVLNTSQIRLLVLDEADKMYTHTFRQDLQRIRKALPNRKQTIACSATFVDNLDQELAKIMKNPLLVSTEERATLLVGIKQFVYELPEQKTSIMEMQLKLDALRHIFGRVAFKQCLIFAGSQSRADSYRNYLEKDGWPCELISGAQDQKTRLEQFKKFREFKTRILISTDLMARGVDSEHVNLVINLELPTDSVTYLHRIGRAGRFGSHGIAISCVASQKDQKTFMQLVTDVGTGMQVLRFPSKSTEEKEPRDVWDFIHFEDDIKYFGLYNAEPTAKAPLASQDKLSLTSSLSENKENLNNNHSSLQQSSIDTNTFLINSKDSAVNMPQLTESSPAPPPAKCPPNDCLLSPAPPQSDNLNTPGESQNGSTHQLITSNTIDDASSIAADSLRSSQQDISRYQSVLMQKSAIPTLVEFLVDRQTSQDTQTKRNHNLFDAYREEVLNDNKEVTEAEVTIDGPALNSSKLAQLKSLLIDKPAPKNSLKENVDLYSDFANFKEEDSSISLSEDIDKQTFILSVTTPSIQQDSLEELRNNSSDLYPATDETRVTTESNDMDKEPRHFPSPAHNQEPTRSSFIPDVIPGPNLQLTKQQPKQKLSINVTAHIEIPPYQSPPVSASPLANALQNHEEVSPSTTASSVATLSNRDDHVQQSGSETERSGGNSSGFDEKTSTSGSSGIDTSENINRRQRQISQYETSSDEEDDSDYSYCESDDEESEHYFGTDEEEDVEGDYDEADDDEEEQYMEEEAHIGEVLFSRPVARESASSSSNTITNNNTNNSLNVAYQSAYSRWVDLYWNQMTIVQDYVKFFNFTRQQQQE